MLKRRKIPCYVIIFEQIDIIKQSLDFLTPYSSELDIIIIENPSKNSDKIGELIKEYGRAGLIKRHYLFDTNITGNAYTQVIKTEADFIKKSKFILLTDGDIKSNNPDWLTEEKKIMRHKDVFACGISLDMTNLPLKTFPDAKKWIPEDRAVHKDYFEVATGIHLVLFQSRGLLGFMDWMSRNQLAFVDGNMHRYCYEVAKKKWARTKHAKAYHMTWDLYANKNHPYTKFKLSKSFEQTWHHKQTADYILTEY